MWHVDKATTHELRKKLVTATALEVYKKKLTKHCLTTACKVFSNALASPQKQRHSRNTLNRSGQAEKNSGPTASELALGSTQTC